MELSQKVLTLGICLVSVIVAGVLLTWSPDKATGAAANIDVVVTDTGDVGNADSCKGPLCLGALLNSYHATATPRDTSTSTPFHTFTPTSFDLPTLTPTPCPEGKVPSGTGCGTPTPTLTPTPCPAGKVPAGVGCGTPTPTPTPKDPEADTDGDTIPNSSDPNDDNDACSDAQENGPDETLGGQRNPHNYWDFYDVAGSPLPPQNGAPDGVIDLPNDILGVIQHHPAGNLGYDIQFDRGPWSGPNSWNDTQGPDGVIDLPNDILGVILQFNHRCA